MTPSCVSINDLAYRLLHVKPAFLKRLAWEAERHYQVGPRLVKGRWRRVAEPDALLMALQRTIYRRLLARIPLSNAVHSVRGRSTFSNAELHCGQPWVIRLDIRDFFPSVRVGRVELVWTRLGFAPRLARILTALTTYERGVGQPGAREGRCGDREVVSVGKRPLFQMGR
jgi:hypothetical protein